MSDRFWDEDAYDEGEPDRVVLCVDLKAKHEGAPVWRRTYVMDAWGDARGTAMARLVSVPVSLAVEAVSAQAIPRWCPCGAERSQACGRLDGRDGSACPTLGGC